MGRQNSLSPLPMMARITSIEPQKRRPRRRSVFVDGEFAAGVDQEVVLALGLRVGHEVDEKRLREMLRAEEVRKAREDALMLLGYRARSVRELERRLKQKGYEEDIVEEVLTGLERADLLNDERFASDWVRSRTAARPMGRARLSWELRQKGVQKEKVEDALEDIDEEREFEMALELARSKANRSPGVDVFAERRRLAGLLGRRGFGWEIVSRVLNEVLPEHEES